MYDEAFVNLSKEQLDEIDAACERFASTANVGGHESIELYLDQADEPLRGSLLLELLDIELSWKKAEGQAVEPADYQARFPNFSEVIEQAFETLNGRHTDNATHVRASDETSCAPATAPPLDPRFADLPHDFGRYRVLELLGRGGMGAVYLALDTALDRQVALKLPEFSGNLDAAQAMQRFHREARSMATVSHPSLCQIYDVGDHEGQAYLTMAYIDGQPLSELIRKEQPFHAEDAVSIVIALALGLEAAHQAGVIHRDLKPANIMVRTNADAMASANSDVPRPAPAGNRDVLITDFGLASRDNPLEPSLTSANTVIGSPSYMAPEQIRAENDRIGPATDVYALGVILYELLCGRRPFEGSGLGVLGEIVSSNPPVPPSRVNGIDERLSRICLKAMSYNVEDRFQTAGEFAVTLQRFNEINPAVRQWPAIGRYAVLSLLFAALLFGIISVTAFSTIDEVDPTAKVNSVDNTAKVDDVDGTGKEEKINSADNAEEVDSADGAEHADKSPTAKVIFDNNFDSPDSWTPRVGAIDADTIGPNVVYSSQGVFGGVPSVDSIQIDGKHGTYSDPSGVGGDYFLGLLEGATTNSYGGHESVTLTLDPDGRQYLNVGFHLSPSSLSFDGVIAAYAGSVSAPVIQVSVWDKAGYDPGGANANSSGTLLGRAQITGNKPLEPQRVELLIPNWSRHSVTLDVSAASGSDVILEFDLVDGGYAALDNLKVTASNTR